MKKMNNFDYLIGKKKKKEEILQEWFKALNMSINRNRSVNNILLRKKNNKK